MSSSRSARWRSWAARRNRWVRTDASGEGRHEGLVLVRKRPRARSASTSGSVVSSTRAVRIARPETPPMFVLRSTRSMRSSHSLDRLDTAFDDDRLVADAGLLLPATFADHLGLRELVETPWGSETGIRSRGGAVVLVDQPTEQIPSANVARTDRDRVPRLGSWGGRGRGRDGAARGCRARRRSGGSIEMPPTSG